MKIYINGVEISEKEFNRTTITIDDYIVIKNGDDK